MLPLTSRNELNENKRVLWLYFQTASVIRDGILVTVEQSVAALTHVVRRALG